MPEWISGMNVAMTRSAVVPLQDFTEEGTEAEPVELLPAPSKHQPRRPVWTCRQCGHEWPCVPARAYILEAWEQTSRAMTMAAYFLQACEDMPAAPAGELYRRFLGWVRNA